MNVRSFLACCAVLVAVAFGGQAVAADKYINGIDPNYPPFAFVDEKGTPSGFDVDALNWIADKMGFTVEHRPMEWDGIIPSLMAKKIDMVCSGMSISPERKAVVTFADPYWSIKKYLLVQSDSKLTKEKILSGGKTLGVQSGTNEAEFLKQEKEKQGWNYTLRFYDSPPLAIEDLINGRIDAAAIDQAPADVAMKKAKKPIKVAGEFAEPDEFGIATRNEDVKLRELLNEGHKLLKADPYWEELQAKYLND